MWLLLAGLALLTGDVLSQAHKIIDSKTDLLAVPSDQLIHSSPELLTVEDHFFQLPFGTKLPGSRQAEFAYSYTIGSDKKETTHTRFTKGNRPAATKILDESTVSSSKHNELLLDTIKLPQSILKLQRNKEKGITDQNSHGSYEDNSFSSNELTDYLPPKKDLPAIESALPKIELNEYLPPKFTLQDDYLPPKKAVTVEYLLPKEDPFKDLKLSEYLPPNEELIEYLAPQEEFTEYLPPKLELTEYLPPKLELTEYLPPKEELTEYLPPKEELTEYLPPKEKLTKHLPPKEELTKYLPPKEELNEYLPPKEELTEYSPPKEVFTDYLPPTENFLKHIHPVTSHENSKKNSESNFSIYIHKSAAKTFIPNDPISITRGKTPEVHLLPPIREFANAIPKAPLASFIPLKQTNYDTDRIHPIGIHAKDSSLNPISVHREVTDEKTTVDVEYHQPQVKVVNNYQENSIDSNHIIANAPIGLLSKESKARPSSVVGEVIHSPIRVLKSQSNIRPYALVSEVVEENIIPTSSVTEQRTLSPLAEYNPVASRFNAIENDLITPTRGQNEISPYAITKTITNKKVIAQSRYSGSPISVVPAQLSSPTRPFKTANQKFFQVISEREYGCQRNDQCSSSDICHNGNCQSGCSITHGLCIGQARCETRHHVPACICPDSFIAVTVNNRLGNVQFDCMAMTMPSNVIARRPQRQSPRRPYNRPVIVAPVRSSHSTPIRNTVTSPIRGSSSHSSFRPTFTRNTLAGAPGSSPCSNPYPCGENTKCEVNRNGVALCRCIDGYVPLKNTIEGCKPQCVSDGECPDDYQCENQKCKRVCQPGACGLYAECKASNNRARCSCPSGYAGNPERNGRCSRVIPEVRVPDPLPIDVCQPNPCGTNADCRVSGSTPVCSCPRGYKGDPLSHCERGECVVHTDCPSHQACRDLKCFDPCDESCGRGAECVTRNNQPVCSCPRNYVGDPFASCRALTEYDICNPSPCGASTNCKVRRVGNIGDMRAVCSCIDKYIGDPLTGCRPECTRDTDCGPNQGCQNQVCRNPCIDGCGDGAYCDVVNHRAMCTCPEYFKGDPHSRCYPECTAHTDCPSHKACLKYECIDPCVGACGTYADCKVENHTPICSCPRDHTGDPFVSCRPFTLEDLCRDNPCGTRAICTPGTDRSGNDRPVCTCDRGFVGNPLVACVQGDCQDHNDCQDHLACYGFMCTTPCATELGSVCGNNADCQVKNHQPICSCPQGYVGNPLSECSVSPSARFAAGHFRSQKK